MPLIHSEAGTGYQLAVWEITEDEAFFESSLGFGTDRKHPHRRLEHLSGRFLLQYLLPDFPFEKIQIAPTGKPFISDQALHFSISHSFPFAAAIVAERPVGIDVQVFVEKILRLQHKFLSEEEMRLCGEDLSHITLAWSAKEALFKQYGLGAVDFKGDMPLCCLDGRNPIEFAIQFKKENKIVLGQGMLFERFSLAFFA